MQGKTLAKEKTRNRIYILFTSAPVAEGFTSSAFQFQISVPAGEKSVSLPCEALSNSFKIHPEKLVKATKPKSEGLAY